ncbi:hypothetical protein M9Y10_043145 [Tritrichomonas musculus]|uniref:Uncharacterized protein n=1 Tax=Tritrichomonas musculus TaxID=1915356 RepID=A0ABR2K0P6_9EUKA
MDSLPFAKRTPRRPIDTTVRERGVFDRVDYHRPQNEQQFVPRKRQDGTYNPREMKITVRVVDSRRDVVDRDRENLLFDSSRTPSELSRLPRFKDPPSLERNTRHLHTPYSYKTGWISHPDRNTSLYPNNDDQWKTSFLQSPSRDLDRIRKQKEEKDKFDTLHYFEQKVTNYYNQVDNDIKVADRRLLHNIQYQRGTYNEALENRRKRDKVKFFE